MGFRLTSVIHQGRKIPISPSEPNNHSNENYFTVIIGRNGTGKSRLLADICRTFDAFDNKNSVGLPKDSITSHRLYINFINDNKKFDLSYNGRSITYFSTGDLFNETIEPRPPQRVIATTITPTDKFPIGQKRYSTALISSEDVSPIYRYLGSKNSVGQLSSTGQLSRVIESLMFASEKSRVELARLNKIFDFLGYHSNITVEYEIKFRKHIIQQQNLFGSKSHRIDDIISALSNDSRRRYAIESEIRKSPVFKDELLESLEAVVKASGKERYCKIELDFESRSFKGSSGFSVGDGVKIEPAKPEPDHDFEPLSISKPTSRVLDSLNL